MDILNIPDSEARRLAEDAGANGHLEGRFQHLDLDRFDVDPAAARSLSESHARRFRALVLKERGAVLLLGMVDPSDLRAQDELALILSRPLEVVQLGLEQWQATADRIYQESGSIREFAREVERDIERDADVVDLNRISGSTDDASAPVVRLLQTVFDHAAKARASDIHLEPRENKLVVRYRIDGVMHVQLQADPKIAAPLVVRMKLMAGLDIAEKRLPQDGRVAVRSGAYKLDVRVSTLPTIHGESVVLRVLRQQGGAVDLRSSGMPPAVQSSFERLIRSPHGILLVTGPTGSGKTTTLYGALQQLNDAAVKILTCEDPVEYRIDGINQVQINDKVGLSFARVLRSFLRQDPDIILVGEIRDQETAETAARAALTGHLVLSTLHTNDAATTPSRLLDMGVAPYMIASTLLGVVSQRLVRLVCGYCSEPHRPNPQELVWLERLAERFDVPLQRRLLRVGRGCPRCNGIGYAGRTGVFEILEMTPELADAIHQGAAGGIEKAAREQLGVNTLDRHVCELVINGRTTIAEAMKITALID